MNLAGVITSFATGTYTGTRTTPRTYDSNGVIGSASTASFTLTNASVQPATGKDLQRLPEGKRGRDTKVVLTSTEVRVGTDRVSIGGSSWEVEHVEDFSELAGFYRAVVQKDGSP